MISALQDHDFIQGRATLLGLQLAQADGQFHLGVEAEIERVGKQADDGALPGREGDQQADSLDQFWLSQADAYVVRVFLPVEIQFTGIGSPTRMGCKICGLHAER